jgi:hypothetical protein
MNQPNQARDLRDQRRGEQLFTLYPQFNNEALDSADRDAILELERSTGYALVKLRVQQEIIRRSAELELPTNIESTQYIRGVIYALRTVLQIPSILKGEIK